MCVRWYLSYKLSYRDLVAMMGERGLEMAHSTILRRVQHYTPEFEKRWSRFARTVGCCWRMEETYVKGRGEWVYLYRAVSRKRNVSAAKVFLGRAMRQQRIPTKLTLDA